MIYIIIKKHIYVSQQQHLIHKCVYSDIKSFYYCLLYHSLTHSLPLFWGVGYIHKQTNKQKIENHKNYVCCYT